MPFDCQAACVDCACSSPREHSSGFYSRVTQLEDGLQLQCAMHLNDGRAKTHAALDLTNRRPGEPRTQSPDVRGGDFRKQAAATPARRISSSVNQFIFKCSSDLVGLALVLLAPNQVGYRSNSLLFRLGWLILSEKNRQRYKRCGATH
jgi:hypothetical protein